MSVNAAIELADDILKSPKTDRMLDTSQASMKSTAVLKADHEQECKHHESKTGKACSSSRSRPMWRT